MSNQTSQPISSGAQKTLLDVSRDVWRARRSIVAAAVAGGVFSILFVLTATPFYRAQMVISPANPMNGAEVSTLLSDDSLSALRFLAQKTGVTNSGDFTRFENIYSGPAVAEYLLKDPKITDGLAQDRVFSTVPYRPEWNAPLLAEYISDRVRLEPVGATSLRRMTYEHPDREFGVYFLSRIHRMADELIRQKIWQEAVQRAEYLHETIGETTNPEHRRALTTLLLEQERLKMLVSIETAYAATIVEPAAPSARAAWPDASMVVPASVFAAAMLGFAFFSFLEAVAASRPQPEEQPKRPRVWFKTNSRNNNEKRLSVRDAAE